MAFCTACGRRLGESANFCTSCGHAIRRVITQEPVPPSRDRVESDSTALTQVVLPPTYRGGSSSFRAPAETVQDQRATCGNNPAYRSPVSERDSTPAAASANAGSANGSAGSTRFVSVPAQKSVVLAGVLGFIFGAVGLLYGTVRGAIIMFLVGLAASVVFYVAMAQATLDSIGGIYIAYLVGTLLNSVVCMMWGISGAQERNAERRRTIATINAA